MSRLLSKERVRDLLLGLALLCATLALMLYPQPSMEAAKSGLALCYNVIIPSLFPFFVLSSLVVELGLAGYLGRLLEGLMRPLFHVSGACASAFALGFIGGYPVGAKTAISLYENGMCTKTEAERLLAFCNNSGPAFILGVVGAGVFASSRVGVLLYLAHAAASICIGILFRFYKVSPTARREERQSRPQFHAQRFTTAFTGSIKNSFLSTLNICAFVVFFHRGDSAPYPLRLPARAGPGAGDGARPLRPHPGVGPTSAYRSAGDLLRCVDSLRRRHPQRQAYSGRLHAGVGKHLRPLSGALLHRGQRPVRGHLSGRQAAPRRPVRPVHRRPGPPLSAGGAGLRLPGRPGGWHCGHGFPPHTGYLSGLRLGALPLFPLCGGRRG
ncbi:hypothetical protein M5E87_01495 [Flavonifractor plautii]|nr:hypothetical protein M5E87_01495 [Flavonifractor plautii]